MRTDSICLALVVVLLCPDTSAQWMQTNGPSGGSIRCFAVTGTNLLAGTDGGVYRSTNNGSSWTAVNDGLDSWDIRSIAVSGANVFAGTFRGVCRSTDNGTNWAPFNIDSTNSYVFALAVSGTHLYAGTSGGVFLSTDNGTKWTQVNTGLTDAYINALAIAGANLLAGTSTGVFLSTNSGMSWSAANNGMTNKYILSLAYSGTRVFAGTRGGGVYLSTNSGSSWIALNVGLTTSDVRVLLVHGTNLFAGTGDGGVFLSTNNGTSWTEVNNGLTTTSIRALAASSASGGTAGTYLFAGTEGAGAFLSTNNGTSWAPVNTGLRPARVVSFAPCGTDLFAGTYGSGIFRSTDCGTSWTAVNAGLSKTFVNTLIASPASGGTGGTNLFAGTEWGGVFLSTDHGTNWIPANAGMANTRVISLAVAPATGGTSGVNLFAGTASDRDLIWRSSDNGMSWTPASTGLPTGAPLRVAALGVSPAAYGADGTILFAGISSLGGSDGVFLSTNDGAEWTEVNGGLNGTFLNALEVCGANLFAGFSWGGVFVSTNRGAVWTQMSTGLPHAYVTSLAVLPTGGATSGTSLFAGTDGGVYLSTNGGRRWNAVNTGLMTTYVDRLAILGQNLFAATSYDGLWRRPLSEMIPEFRNLVKNPGFESGTEPWRFYTNGSGEFSDNVLGPSSPHAGLVHIGSAGTNVQLYQSGIPLKAGTRYRLSFKAFSSSGHRIRVCIHKHGEPYTNYGLDGWDINLGRSWNTHMAEFTAENFTDSVDDARLLFWLAPYGSEEDHYYIDDVILERIEPNLLVNGGFEWGVDPWKFYTDGSGAMDADAPGDSSDHAVHLTIGTSGTNVQLYQSGVRLEAGVRYALQFKAYSNTGHDLSVSVLKHGEPYANYGLDESKVDLGSSWKAYYTEFTAKNFIGTMRDGRLRFWLAPYAKAGDQYVLDDIVLTRLDTSRTPGVLSASKEGDAGQPKEFSLGQNYPNPFNPSTTIKYELPKSSIVRLSVYDMLGREVLVLVNEWMDAGYHEVGFDASGLSSGVYLYRLRAGDYVATKKMLSLK